MTDVYDLVIIGGGPAGLAAAMQASELDLRTVLIDEQPAPGGQIYRAVERAERDGLAARLGPDYRRGASLAGAFRACGADYEAGCQVWQAEAAQGGPGQPPRQWTVHFTRDGQSRSVRGRHLLLASGAQERPVPIRGWTLPGVMTVGAAQLLLKSSRMLPEEPVWIAGSGPLPLLYASQLLSLGGRLAGYIDTTPRGRWRAALPHLPGALANAPYLAKGITLRWTLLRSGVEIQHAEEIEARGTGRLEAVRFRTTRGIREEPARVLLLHEGVIPNAHAAMALGCAQQWDEGQQAFRPETDEWGASSVDGLSVAGDAAGIGGARVAEVGGRIAALGAAHRLGRIGEAGRDALSMQLRRERGRHARIRPFLDALFRPNHSVLVPPDDVLACRCEEVTVGGIRQAVSLGAVGPNQVKSYTRCGMGPCQGRQCAPTLAQVIADSTGQPVADVGYPRIRPPLKPITLGELATLAGERAA